MGLLSDLGDALAGGGLPILGDLYGQKKERDFANAQTAMQIHLANTAHQREVADLRAAGLNPILSVNRSGAPSNLAMGAHFGSVGQNAVSSALGVHKTQAEVDKIREEIQSIPVVRKLTETQIEHTAEGITLLVNQAQKIVEEKLKLHYENVTNEQMAVVYEDEEWLNTLYAYSQRIGLNASDLLDVFKIVKFGKAPIIKSPAIINKVIK